MVLAAVVPVVLVLMAPLSGGNGGIGVQIPTTYRNPAASVGAPGPSGVGWFAGGGGGKGHPAAGTGGGSGGPYAGAGMVERGVKVMLVLLLTQDLVVVLLVNLMVVEAVLVSSSCLSILTKYLKSR